MLVLRLGVIGSICSLGALLSSQHWVFDLISPFRIQYIGLIAIVLSIALYRQRYKIALILALCMSVHIYDVYRSQSLTEINGRVLTAALSVMSSNLYAANNDYENHVDFLKSTDPDIIVFQEYTTAWDAALSDSLGVYPYRLIVPMDTPFGIAVYSKLPLLDEKVVYLLSNVRPSIEANVSVAGKLIKIFGTHAPPPMSNVLYTERNQHFQKISEIALEQTDAMIVMGDLNVSPWSDHFRYFLESGELSDGRRGFGVLPTWPTWFLPLQIPIDHIVVNSSVSVTAFSSSSDLNSDHRTIWANLEF